MASCVWSFLRVACKSSSNSFTNKVPFFTNFPSGKLNEYPFHYLLLLYKLSLRIDLVRWAKKWSEVGVENFSVWVPTYFVGASLKVFSLRTTNFLSEAGAVLTFFAYFFVLRQKSKWGFRGKAPVVLKSKALGNLSDNHIKIYCSEIPKMSDSFFFVNL